MDRRTFLATATAVAPGLRAMADRPPRLPSRAGTRLILLGTAGGQRPRATRGAPAQVIIANGSAHVVDCGNGAARQLVTAGVPLRSIRNVFTRTITRITTPTTVRCCCCVECWAGDTGRHVRAAAPRAHHGHVLRDERDRYRCADARAECLRSHAVHRRFSEFCRVRA